MIDMQKKALGGDIAEWMKQALQRARVANTFLKEPATKIPPKNILIPTFRNALRPGCFRQLSEIPC